MSARRRNTPSVLTAAFERWLDWDGRATTLEEQALGVFTRDGDAGIDIGEAVAIVLRDRELAGLFRRAYRRGPDADGLLGALAHFQRSLHAGPSPFDRFLLLGDTFALSAAQRRGWSLFASPRGGCAGCHSVQQVTSAGELAVPLFTDFAFHNLGVGYRGGRMSDLGRYAVTHDPRHWGAFKTPSLRNVAITPPYMHDGSLATLADVVAFYAAGGIANPNRDPIMGRRNLGAREQADIVAFLHALTSDALADSAVTAGHWHEALQTGHCK